MAGWKHTTPGKAVQLLPSRGKRSDLHVDTLPFRPACMCLAHAAQQQTMHDWMFCAVCNAVLMCPVVFVFVEKSQKTENNACVCCCAVLCCGVLCCIVGIMCCVLLCCAIFVEKNGK